jgi:hypothetical protein
MGSAVGTLHKHKDALKAAYEATEGQPSHKRQNHLRVTLMMSLAEDSAREELIKLKEKEAKLAAEIEEAKRNADSAEKKKSPEKKIVQPSGQLRGRSYKAKPKTDCWNKKAIEASYSSSKHVAGTRRKSMDTANSSTTDRASRSFTVEGLDMTHIPSATDSDQSLSIDRTGDCWDSALEQPFCPICTQAFATDTRLDTHIKYSAIHARHVSEYLFGATEEEKAAALEAIMTPRAATGGGGAAAAAGRGMNTNPTNNNNEKSVTDLKVARRGLKEGLHYKMLYNGNKFFFRTQDNFEVRIYLHSITNSLELCFYDGTRNKEAPRLYADHTRILTLLEPAISYRLQTQKQQELQDSRGNSNATQRVKEKWDLMIKANSEQALMSSILARLHQAPLLSTSGRVGPKEIILSEVDHGCPLAVSSSMLAGNFNNMPAGVSALDELSLLATRNPPCGLVPVPIAWRRRSTSEEIKSQIESVELEQLQLKQCVDRAERISSTVMTIVREFSHGVKHDFSRYRKPPRPLLQVNKTASVSAVEEEEEGDRSRPFTPTTKPVTIHAQPNKNESASLGTISLSSSSPSSSSNSSSTPTSEYVSPTNMIYESSQTGWIKLFKWAIHRVILQIRVGKTRKRLDDIQQRKLSLSLSPDQDVSNNNTNTLGLSLSCSTMSNGNGNGSSMDTVKEDDITEFRSTSNFSPTIGRQLSYVNDVCVERKIDPGFFSPPGGRPMHSPLGGRSAGAQFKSLATDGVRIIGQSSSDTNLHRSGSGTYEHTNTYTTSGPVTFSGTGSRRSASPLRANSTTPTQQQQARDIRRMLVEREA